MISVKKIYVDSRNRTSDSVDASNFKIELPYSITMPDNCRFYISDVGIPHVWKTIEDNVNDRLYLEYTSPNGSLPVLQARPSTNYEVFRLASGNYTGATLATEIQNKLNQVTNSYITFTVTYDTTQLSITITCNGTNTSFKIYTDQEIVQHGLSSIHTPWHSSTGLVVDPGNPNTINDLTKVNVPRDSARTLTTDFVNLKSINNVYITSPNMGSFDTISSFSNNRIKKVPVNVGYGFMIVDQSSYASDYLKTAPNKP